MPYYSSKTQKPSNYSDKNNRNGGIKENRSMKKYYKTNVNQLIGKKETNNIVSILIL